MTINLALDFSRSPFDVKGGISEIIKSSKETLVKRCGNYWPNQNKVPILK